MNRRHIELKQQRIKSLVEIGGYAPPEPIQHRSVRIPIVVAAVLSGLAAVAAFLFR